MQTKKTRADNLKNVITLKGKVHDARVQCIDLCVRVTVHTVEIVWRLAGLLGEWTVRKVRDCVEGRGLSWGRGHGGQASLSLELGLKRVVLVHGQTGQRKRDDRRRLHLGWDRQREATWTAGQPSHSWI